MRRLRLEAASLRADLKVDMRHGDVVSCVMATALLPSRRLSGFRRFNFVYWVGALPRVYRRRIDGRRCTLRLLPPAGGESQRRAP